jgi:hypothetical protein
VLLILAAPARLMADALRSFTLFGDDFIYIAHARDAPTLFEHLLAPHNTHFVPLFRLWTYLLVGLSGRLARLPDVLEVASYAALAAAMLSVGILVRRETRSTAAGLAAMAATGISTVVEPAVIWYSAGQALWAGVMIVLTLLAAQAWSLRPAAWRLVLAALGVLAAPAVWTGGLAAGPAASVYLWARGRQRAAALLIGATVLAAAVVAAVAQRQARAIPIIWEVHPEVWPRPIQAVINTAQAIPEALVFANLGLDAPTTPVQGIVLTVGLLAAWLWTRRTAGRVHPLAAAGLIIVLSSFLMVYFFRGNFAYENLRELGWYHAIPHLGAVLFASGWWAGGRPRAGGLARLTRGGALLVLGLVVALSLLQGPRALRLFLDRAPALTPGEMRRFPIPELKRLRAIYLLDESRARQIRALRRLDLAEEAAARLGIGRMAIRSVFGRVLVPGIPENQTATDAVDLLRLPPKGPTSDPARVRAALAKFLSQEPEPRPPWLDPAEAWPAE